MKALSVVVPALNEAEELPETLRRARQIPEVSEIIVVDGGSVDSTRPIAEAFGCRLLATPASRGGQMRLGAENASGDVVVLLHADTWLPLQAGRAIARCLEASDVVAGGFWKRFRTRRWGMMGSRVRCALHLWFAHLILGDQAMFVRREVLENIGGVPNLPLMEEFELCRRLRRVGRLALARATVTTSARRFTQLGVMRTYLLMWRITLCYYCGTPVAELQEIYERESGRRRAV